MEAFFHGRLIRRPTTVVCQEVDIWFKTVQDLCKQLDIYYSDFHCIVYLPGYYVDLETLGMRRRHQTEMRNAYQTDMRINRAEFLEKLKLIAVRCETIKDVLRPIPLPISTEIYLALKYASECYLESIC